MIFWKRHSCIYIFRILFYLFIALSVQFLLSYCCIGTELYTYNNRFLFFKRKTRKYIDHNSISCRQKLALFFRKEHRVANLQRIRIFKHQKFTVKIPDGIDVFFSATTIFHFPCYDHLSLLLSLLYYYDTFIKNICSRIHIYLLFYEI